MTLTLKQMLAIVCAVLSALAVATSQMNDIFGPTLAKSIMAGAGILNTIFSSILAVITSQTQTVKDVQSMPGVEKITVNAQANSTLAGLAMATDNAKIEAAPGQDAAVDKASKS